MGIYISIVPNGFRLKLDGMRKKFIAKEITNVLEGVAHYYGADHNRLMCPLCEVIE